MGLLSGLIKVGVCVACPPAAPAVIASEAIKWTTVALVKGDGGSEEDVKNAKRLGSAFGSVVTGCISTDSK